MLSSSQISQPCPIHVPQDDGCTPGYIAPPNSWGDMLRSIHNSISELRTRIESMCETNFITHQALRDSLAEVAIKNDQALSQLHDLTVQVAEIAFEDDDDIVFEH